MAWKVEYDPNHQFMMIDPSGNVKVLNGITLWKQLEKHIIYFTNLENAFVEDFIEENRGELYGFQNVF